jgi:hypothetical protein
MEGVRLGNIVYSKNQSGRLVIFVVRSTVVSLFILLSICLFPKLGLGQYSVTITGTVNYHDDLNAVYSVLQGIGGVSIYIQANPSYWTDAECTDHPEGACIYDQGSRIDVAWYPRQSGIQTFTFEAVGTQGPVLGMTATQVVTINVIADSQPVFIQDPSQLSDYYRGFLDTYPLAQSGGVLEVKACEWLYFSVFANDPDDIPWGDGIGLVEAYDKPAGFLFEPISYPYYDVDGDGLFKEFTGFFSWQPNGSQIGTHHISFWAWDYRGYICDSTDTFQRQPNALTITINVLPGDRPEFTEPPESEREKKILAETELTFIVAATDPKGSVVSITCESKPDQAIFLGGGGSTPSQGLFTWTPRLEDIGTHTATFRATNNCGMTQDMTVTIKVETDCLRIITPAEGQVFSAAENLPGQTTETLVQFLVKAVGPSSCPLISLNMSSSVPSSGINGPFFNPASGNPVEEPFSWWPQVGQAGDYTATFTASASGYDSVTRTVNIHIDHYAGDRDGDGIPDALDEEPDHPSNDFKLGKTKGTIESRGDQQLNMADDGGRVLIFTSPGGGSASAIIKNCRGGATVYLNSDKANFVWCSSAGVTSVRGAIDVEFADILGQYAYTTLGEGNTVVFEPQNYSFTTPTTNLSPVTVTVNSVDHAIQPGEVLVMRKDDFIGTWDGQGVYALNSETKSWVKLASIATLLAEGDLDGGGLDDLIGIWPAQGGVWVRSQETGVWTKLSSTARAIAAGDLNGDGRTDLLGTWDGQGVYYRDSTDGSWVKLASPADLITTGDLDGDGTDDLIGIWPAQGGVWVKYSESGTWARLSSTARDIAAGDMNGDGRDDLLATWDGQGVFYRDSMTGAWVKMASQADQVTCGDVDGDIKADLIGIWPAQAGVWVKYSRTGGWARLASTAGDITAGKTRPVGDASPSGIQALPMPMGGLEAGLEGNAKRVDVSSKGPGGRIFSAREEGDFCPIPAGARGLADNPGPGEPGFTCSIQENLYPGEVKESKKEPQPETTKEPKKR